MKAGFLILVLLTAHFVRPCNAFAGSIGSAILTGIQNAAISAANYVLQAVKSLLVSIA
jgi:hypothetical protein